MKSHRITNATGVLAVLVAALLAGPSAVGAELEVPAQYATIQQAVDAAGAGDTILIAPGVYTGQVLIVRKNLTIIGAPGAIVRATPGMSATLQSTGLPDGGVDRWPPLLGAVDSDVVLKGLTFEGEHLGDPSSRNVYSAITFSGTSGAVEDCTVRGFRRAKLDINGFGFMAANEPALGTAPVHIDILHNTFADNGTSLLIRGAGTGSADGSVERLTFSIADNTIAGVGPTDQGPQIGLWIGAGASGDVRRNTITGHFFTGTAPRNLASSTTPTFPSMGVIGLDVRYYFYGVSSPAPLQPVVFEENTFVTNQQHLALFKADGSNVANNSFAGAGTTWRPVGLILSGTNVMVERNGFSEIPTGITLLGNDPDYGGIVFGIASGTQLTANRFCTVTKPIQTESLVTGVNEQGTMLCPFPDPTLALASAVILSWPGYYDGWILECAPSLNGPWTAYSLLPTLQDGQTTISVPTDGEHRFFRLHKP